MSESKNITLLVSHPDDEIIFGWPVLKRAKRIVCIASDRFNAARAWCRERSQCLKDVGRLVGAEAVCLDYDSEFYHLPHRPAQRLKEMAREVHLALGTADLIYTHNPWGEYGHMDHILTHYLAHVTGARILCSDMAHEVDWLPVKRWSFGPRIEDCTLNRWLYDECKRIYDARGCWTWSEPPIEQCGLYRCFEPEDRHEWL